jgi:uridine kinase
LIRRILRDQKTRGTDILSTVTTWRNSVIKMHQKYVEPMKYISDMIIPWAENNIVPIKAISGALEYMIYSNKRTRNSKASKK